MTATVKTSTERQSIEVEIITAYLFRATAIPSDVIDLVMSEWQPDLIIGTDVYIKRRSYVKHYCVRDEFGYCSCSACINHAKRIKPDSVSAKKGYRVCKDVTCGVRPNVRVYWSPDGRCGFNEHKNFADDSDKMWFYINGKLYPCTDVVFTPYGERRHIPMWSNGNNEGTNIYDDPIAYIMRVKEDVR